MCAKNSNDLGQGHVPQFIRERSGYEPLCCMEDVVLHNKEPYRKKKNKKTIKQNVKLYYRVRQYDIYIAN